jgi:hypothetical protein
MLFLAFNEPQLNTKMVQPLQTVVQLRTNLGCASHNPTQRRQEYSDE